MASYKSGFDPPPRPGELTRTRRMGTYIQPATEKKEHREADIAHISGPVEGRRENAPGHRPPQTGLPRPSMREPPTLRPRPETKPRTTPPSSFGFGRSAPKPDPRVPGPAPPALRGKSSRNVLRRKASSIAHAAESSTAPPGRTGPSSSSHQAQESTERRPGIDASLKSADTHNEIYTRSRPQPAAAVTESPPIIPELDRYRFRPEQHAGPSRTMQLPHKLSTQNLPPAFPTIVTPVQSGGSSHHRYSGYSGSGYSASPSTRFSESPGPGAYSRDTTPTSMSSQSPGIIAPLKTGTPRLRQGSIPMLNRPPVTSVTRRRAASIPNEAEATPIDPNGLPSLRESLTSSSSNSTVKGEGKSKEKKKKTRLSPLPPSPPPRKSSQKFKKPRPGDFDSPSKPSQSPAKPVMDEEPPASAPASRPRDKTLPPVRPSREGAPDLQSQLGPSMPIIQSNLAGFSFSQNKRQSSIPRGATPSPLQIQTSFRPQPGSRIPARNPTPSPVLALPREATPAPSGLGIIPDLRPRQIPSSTRGTTPSPSTLTKSRFALFGRRTKTAPEIPTIDSKDKASRKGPAAGTGHEGYGKYAIRGRSSSATGMGRGHERNLSIASSSQESTASMPATFDPFLLHRINPVVIAGGGEIIENQNENLELSRTESNTSLQSGRPGHESKGSGKSNLGHEVSRTTLWPSALPKEPVKRMSTRAPSKGRRPSDSSDDGMRVNNLAVRRSVQRLNNNALALNLPRPLNIPSVAMSSSMTSLDASLMSDDSRMEPGPETRGRKFQLTKPRKLEKRQKSPTKWNFFHRSKPAAKPVAPTMAVTVGKSAVKAVPHYAMLDSSDEQQDVDPMDLEDILRDADVPVLSNEELDALQFGADQENMRRIENLRINIPSPVPAPAPAPAPAPEQIPAPILFSSPEPMQVTPELPQTELHLVRETAPVRPSRLPQVGRIPKVISARPEATSPKSFSRPFARLSVAHPQPLAMIDKDSVAVGPSPPKPSTPEPFHMSEEIRNSRTRESSGDSKTDSAVPSHRDFLAFSPRKNSETTTSSSGGLSLQLVGTTAVIPEADAALEEDEVWDEYDDLMENDDTVVPPSATSSHGVPFQYENYESRRVRKSRLRPKESLPKESPTFPGTPKINEPAPEPERISALTSSSVYSGDMSERLKDALAAAPSPATPMSFTDFFSGYGDRNNSFQEGSSSRPRRSSQASSRKSGSSGHSRSTSGFLSINEEENPSPISQVNLRVGSMTVSKWLTFGHVLFSPAREEVSQPEAGSSKTHSILVIDGLGNDDWSFYAAETYPHATFYNLSPTRPLSSSLHPSTSPAPAFPSTPPNHRQIQYLSPSLKFPFPSSTFSVVVFRFPAAMSESSYQNIISESKRVLKPGGYLEMAILDLDMMNMGNRARRAVRGLKVKMQIADAAVWTGSASDTVLRLIGRRGFADVKTCNVGVPVASTIPSSSSKSKSNPHPDNTDPPSTPSHKGREPETKQDSPSLPELLKLSSPSSDESITKMVAKVGRWWYTRCYESVVIPDFDPARTPDLGAAERSMWYADGGMLMRECEKRGASFKLVVAYAQKPVSGQVVGRKRGASV